MDAPTYSDTIKKKHLAMALAAFAPSVEVDLTWKDTKCGVRWKIAAGEPFQRCVANQEAIDQVRARMGALGAIVDDEVRKNWMRMGERLLESPEALSMDQVEWLLYIDELPTRTTKGPYGGNAPLSYRLQLNALPEAIRSRIVGAFPAFSGRERDLLSLAEAGSVVGPPPTTGGGGAKASGSAVAPRTAVDDVVDLLTGLVPQVVLHGPPGTGKTRLARLAALRLLGDTDTDAGDPRAVDAALDGLHAAKRFELVVFHPAYDYDQFVGGLRVRAGTDGHPDYRSEDGVIVRLADAASDGRPAILIIDEINRGNVPRLLGELLFALEYRRAHTRLSYREEAWSLPEQLYVIATMNTADRSIDSLDVAVRRRFAFFEVPADPYVVERHWASGGETGLATRASDTMQALNAALGSPDFEGLAVGPSYFLAADAVSLRLKLRHQLLPLLGEYARLSGRDLQQAIQVVRDLEATLLATDAS